MTFHHKQAPEAETHGMGLGQEVGGEAEGLSDIRPSPSSWHPLLDFLHPQPWSLFPLALSHCEPSYNVDVLPGPNTHLGPLRAGHGPAGHEQ